MSLDTRSGYPVRSAIGSLMEAAQRLAVRGVAALIVAAALLLGAAAGSSEPYGSRAAQCGAHERGIASADSAPRGPVQWPFALAHASRSPQSTEPTADLLWLAILVVAMTGSVSALILRRRHDRCLSQLAAATEAVGRADYTAELPTVHGGHAAHLVAAVERLREQVRAREQALLDLNRELEQRVAARTRALRISQRRLSRQEALQRLVLENIGDGVVAFDRAGRLLVWNRRAEGLVGPGPRGLPPEDWTEHFGLSSDESGRPIPASRSPVLRTLRGESCDAAQLYVRNAASPAGRWLALTGRPLHDDIGQVVGGVVTLRDISELRREESRRLAHRAELAKVGRLALLGELAALVSHQLSQPLSAMANYAGAALQLQRGGRLDSTRLAEILTHITRLADRAGANLQGIRALMQRRDAAPLQVDLNQLIDTCLQLIADRVSYAGVELDLERSDQLPLVYADPLVLEQVLMHLLINAIDAVCDQPRGQRRVTLRTRRLTDPIRALLIVEDSGKGLCGTSEEEIFEPWVTTKPNSLGVGLSIVRTIIENHDGRVWMESPKRGGMVFFLELPGMQAVVK